LLKLHQIYFKSFLLFLFSLFIVISIEAYYFEYKTFLLVMGATFIIFSGLFYLFITKIMISLQDEVSKIISFLKNLTKKEKKEFIDSNFSQEFKKITKLLTKISHILIKQEQYRNAYTEKLEYTNTQKDEIISAISHEFKNPIAVINGYSETLLKDDNLPKSLRKKFLAKIHKNGNKLTNLIDTLRLAIKLDEKKQKMDFKEIDIYQVAQDIVEDVKDSYDREIKVFGKSTIIKADKVLIGVAIRNLVENGIKYSEHEVLVMIKENSISIIDKGIGISKKDIDKITQKFYRVSNNTWNNSLGLGLSIVNNIVKLHNFKLEIKSELHKGSEFIIRF
jgi:signal transduction histidine kinase